MKLDAEAKGYCPECEKTTVHEVKWGEWNDIVHSICTECGKEENEGA